MKSFTLLMALFLMNSVRAENLLCRDRSNFMSSWYELHLQKKPTEMSGKLVFITDKGFKVLQNFHLDLIENNSQSQKFAGDQVVLNWKKGSVINFVEFKTYALENTFRMGFKCPLTDMTFQRSSWGNLEAALLFNKLNLPIKQSNGGFREIRKFKEVKTVDESFSLYASEVGESIYAYTFKLNLNSTRLKVFQDIGQLKVYFNDQDSKIIRDLLGKEPSLQLNETQLQIHCDLECSLTSRN